MKEVRTGYAVKITRVDGSAFFASVGHGSGAFFVYVRKQATAYKRELLKNGINKCRVVKVRQEMQEIE